LDLILRIGTYRIVILRSGQWRPEQQANQEEKDPTLHGFSLGETCNWMIQIGYRPNEHGSDIRPTSIPSTGLLRGSDRKRWKNKGRATQWHGL